MATDADRYAVASQAQLIWWRFKRHRMAMISMVVLAVFYILALGADFLATSDPQATDSRTSYIAPQPIHLFDADGSFRPWVAGIKGVRDVKTFKLVYTVDSNRRVYIEFFGHGYKYSFLGLETDRHLMTLKDAQRGEGIYLFGTDLLGRDLWSRLAVATRVSLTIGLVGVTISLFLGVLLGGLSAVYGGVIDTIIQRAIEVIRSLPAIPLWLGLSAALPNDWSVTQVYFAITIIISLLTWTDLARVVRGKFLALREEDFILAAELAGASQLRIVFHHLLPSFTSHIIAAVSLALPAMIISETSLSFLGLGLRPPAISWGILLQDAQNVQTLALAPWLLLSAVPVVLVILAFNFLGDGLRDAADPYG
ncbi:MAG: ABC transporter permease [Acetobacteraceae bacterium]|nr:ABC transporter permease [Acetobacteraceae bacterium]